jgi:prolyl-tRNA synthetase
MRQTELFTKTSKDSPKDEQSINSILLLRAGFIDRESR